MFLNFLLSIFSLFLFYGQLTGEQFNEPVDVVYLWVNGNDPEWQAIKSECYAKERGQEIQPDAIADHRYSDHNELKYSLRSVWKYASFVNHIYIVTMDQKPEWLMEHPKITLISHKDIFKDQDDLPTFNSMAIETHLHRISHLSEYFIYFNDDMFLGKPVKASDFFGEKGEIKVLFEEKWVSPKGIPKPTDITFWAACRNTNNLLDVQIKNEERMLICHSPYALSKSGVEEAERKFPEVFASNSKHKFRSFEDFTITNGLLQYYWNYQGKVKKCKLTNIMVYFFDDEKIKKTLKQLKKVDKAKPHTYCLQDKTTSTGLKTQELLNEFFENRYPQPAPWEKS